MAPAGLVHYAVFLEDELMAVAYFICAGSVLAATVSVATRAAVRVRGACAR